MPVKILLIVVVLFLQGCEINPPSKDYTDFVEKYGNSLRYYCDKETGFFMKEFFWQSTNKNPSLSVIRNDIEQPVRCTGADISVLETSLGTQRD